jgi:hypothetical protein
MAARYWRLVLLVFLPFVAAYYLSYLFRTINALISDRLVHDFGLGASHLGVIMMKRPFASGSRSFGNHSAGALRPAISVAITIALQLIALLWFVGAAPKISAATATVGPTRQPARTLTS